MAVNAAAVPRRRFFGRLTIIGRPVARVKWGRLIARWPCRCDCGAELKVEHTALFLRRRRQCPKCDRAGVPVTGETATQGTPPAAGADRFMTGLPEYSIWIGIKERCFNPHSEDFARYGARGITMAPEWRNNFPVFLAHMGPRPSPKHSVGRKKNALGYEPDNVRWEIPEEQARNKTNTRYIEFNGMRKSHVEWAEHLGLSLPGLHARIRKWGIEEALTRPVREKRTGLDPALEGALVAEYLETGATGDELAEKFGTTRKTVDSVLTRHGARAQRIEKAGSGAG